MSGDFNYSVIQESSSMYSKKLKRNMYKENLRHILKHRWFVMLECFKVGLFWHGITHDVSKLLPSEFIGYSENFFSDKFELTHIAIVKFKVTCAEELPIGALPEDKFKKLGCCTNIEINITGITG